MGIRNKKLFGFTLAEVLIVLLVLTIIFAAFAPFITQRIKTKNRSKYAVWNWADSSYTNGPMNAYTETGDAKHSSEMFFGTMLNSSGEIYSKYSPFSKIIIRSGLNDTIQRQMLFITPGSSSTSYASLLADGKNLLFGSIFSNYEHNNFSSDGIVVTGNTVYGVGAMQDMSNIGTSGTNNNTALGAYALQKYTAGGNNTAIGYMAGSNETSTTASTFVGSNAASKGVSYYDVAVGYNSGSSSNQSDNKSNIIIGTNAASGMYGGSYGNVVIGANAGTNVGSNNVVLGADALQNVNNPNNGNNTAIGYKACDTVSGQANNKTCIGAYSTPSDNTTKETTASKVIKNAHTDNTQRTYIGGTPYNFGGDAVMEIHNLNTTNEYIINSPSVKTNATTVINGNLYVKGNIYFSVGDKLFNYLGAGTGPYSLKRGVGGGHAGEYTSSPYEKTESVTHSYVDKVCASYPSSTSFSTSCNINLSDRRLKNIKGKSTAGLDKIKQLKVYSYNFKKDKDKKYQIGVIAQDLMKVFPNSVSLGADGYYRIRWDEMLFAAVNAVKELDLKIIKITKELCSVEHKIAKLEKENTILEQEVKKLSARIEKLKQKSAQ